MIYGRFIVLKAEVYKDTDDHLTLVVHFEGDDGWVTFLPIPFSEFSEKMVSLADLERWVSEKLKGDEP